MIVRVPRWSRIHNPVYPWVSTIDRILSASPLPDLNGSIIKVFSDYSGAHKGSGYDVTGLLYLDFTAAHTWEFLRRDVRRLHLADGRRMAFKALNDQKRRDALVPFLQAANEIPGLLVAFAVRKSIKNLCLSSENPERVLAQLSLKRSWRIAAFERMMRLTHFVALLIAGLSLPDQHIYWVSDEDSLMANEATTRDLGDMLSRFTSYYVKHPLGELGLGSAVIDPGDRYEEDCVAVVDLAVGAISEMINQVAGVSGGSIRHNLAVVHDQPFARKTELILSWFYHPHSALRKVCIVFERPVPGTIAVSRFDMTTDDRV